jgi:hypothetical protein
MVMDETDRHRVRAMQLFSPRLLGHHQIGILEDPEVLHDTDPCHRHLPLELRQGSPFLLEEEIEQETPCWIGERLEHSVVVAHILILRN